MLSSWSGIVRLHTSSRDKVQSYKDGNITLKLHGKGWRGVGYHYALQLTEGLHTQQVLLHSGRYVLTQGAGVKGKNANTIHVCLVGNYSRCAVPVLLHRQAVVLVATLMEVFRIPIDRVVGHREIAATECPGILLDLNHFRASVLRNYPFLSSWISTRVDRHSIV